MCALTRSDQVRHAVDAALVLRDHRAADVGKLTVLKDQEVCSSHVSGRHLAGQQPCTCPCKSPT